MLTIVVPLSVMPMLAHVESALLGPYIVSTSPALKVVAVVENVPTPLVAMVRVPKDTPFLFSVTRTLPVGLVPQAETLGTMLAAKVTWRSTGMRRSNWLPAVCPGKNTPMSYVTTFCGDVFTEFGCHAPTSNGDGVLRTCWEFGPHTSCPAEV